MKESVKDLAMPIVDLLREKGNPYQAIIVTQDNIKIIYEECSIPIISLNIDKKGESKING